MTQLNYSIIRLWCVFLAQHKLVDKVVLVGARCSWPNAASFMLCQTSVSLSVALENCLALSSSRKFLY